ncbi:MAG TPA: GNAT family N-acetyltransferase [Longimicrobium sp.]|nr:GNAT family N-acetyltransferase [Longimicrobium sp.]
MRVREYTRADRDACLAVFDSNVPAYFVAAEREAFAAFLDGLPGPYLVVEDGAGAIVGCGGYAIAPETRTADLCWGMVARGRHGTGLGRLLLDARLDGIRADPRVDAVALNTSQHTRGFYERRGFVTERVVPDGFAPGLDRCDMRLVTAAGRERASGG